MNENKITWAQQPPSNGKINKNGHEIYTTKVASFYGKQTVDLSNHNPILQLKKKKKKYRSNMGPSSNQRVNQRIALLCVFLFLYLNSWLYCCLYYCLHMSSSYIISSHSLNIDESKKTNSETITEWSSPTMYCQLNN